jgi:hypothetical protein
MIADVSVDVNMRDTDSLPNEIQKVKGHRISAMPF